MLATSYLVQASQYMLLLLGKGVQYASSKRIIATLKTYEGFSDNFSIIYIIQSHLKSGSLELERNNHELEVHRLVDSLG